MSDLKASEVIWKRLRIRLIMSAVIVSSIAGAVYVLSGGHLLLDADGMIKQDRVAVSTPFDSRVKEVYVRPGDYVRSGQKIAAVESASISRTLAELSIERARMMARVAQLEGRRNVVKAMLPLAEANAHQNNQYLETIRGAQARGLMVERAVNEVSTGAIAASERSLSLKSEAVSVETELQGTQAALKELTATAAGLSESYNNGILIAPSDGYVGATVASVGEIISGTGAKVAQIYSGTTYALAYIPERYLLSVEKGQKVGLKGRNQVVTAIIEQVLPVTETLPPEFQLPNRSLERGQLVRIALHDDSPFAVEQTVKVTSCFRDDCKDGLSGFVMASLPKLREELASWAAATSKTASKAPEAFNALFQSNQAKAGDHPQAQDDLVLNK